MENIKQYLNDPQVSNAVGKNFELGILRKFDPEVATGMHIMTRSTREEENLFHLVESVKIIWYSTGTKIRYVNKLRRWFETKVFLKEAVINENGLNEIEILIYYRRPRTFKWDQKWLKLNCPLFYERHQEDLSAATTVLYSPIQDTNISSLSMQNDNRHQCYFYAS